ncbi:hypothetical protein NPIL_704461 [Nephila pilipes]|uniref:Uncharacterized protein n=1 Tax=Nephila pilipes TaxID=299642 RepID=A0A8X6NLZ9_NEPPI|nr:hypothetical protein NPIL_704461 [Nephila pilipes]
MGVAHQVSLNQNVLLVKEKTREIMELSVVSLADGSKIEREVNTTCVKIRLGGRTLPLVAIPGAKNNNTLLGMDVLESSGIVLNVKRKTLFFDDQPKRQFHFLEQIQESCNAVKSNVSQTTAPLTVKETDHPDLSHADEVNHLTSIQQLELKDYPDQLREEEDSSKLPVGVYHTLALTPFQGNVIPPVKAVRRRGRPARIIKPSSPTPANSQKHKGSQNTSSADPWSGRLRGQRGRLQPMV